MRVIICGGRNYDDPKAAFSKLDKVHSVVPITHVIEGGAKGADRLARIWAIRNNIPYTTVNADWDTYGKRAGYLRNKKMRDEHNPQMVIAMPGGAGTKMMINLANEKNIRVLQWKDINHGQ